MPKLKTTQLPQIKGIPLAIAIPTYNEAENIASMVPTLFKLYPTAHVFIADDNSPDGTQAVVTKLQKKYSQLHLIAREKKEGIGRAYLHAFSTILPYAPKAIVQMDADFSHDPLVIKEMLSELKTADVVIGSRYITGISVINWALERVLLSYFANVYVRWITRLPLRDSTGGYKCWKREVLEAIRFERIASGGYSFQIEMNYAAWRLGFKIKETPIIFVDREKGVSKMNKKIIIEALTKVLTLPLRRLSSFKNPKK
jgi:dolichol-phosphate mannosyltransferase